MPQPHDMHNSDVLTHSMVDVLNDISFNQQGDGKKGEVENEEVYAIATRHVKL